MKRSISILFVLIATCLLMAHAVVPHHHHNKIPVALINVFDDGDHHSDRSHHHSGQSHHHSDGDEDCLISQAQVSSSQKSHENVSKPLRDNLKAGVHLPVLIAKCIGAVVWQTPSIYQFLNAHYFRHKPYLERLHIKFVARASGLRAPPFC